MVSRPLPAVEPEILLAKGIALHLVVQRTRSESRRGCGVLDAATGSAEHFPQIERLVAFQQLRPGIGRGVPCIVAWVDREYGDIGHRIPPTQARGDASSCRDRASAEAMRMPRSLPVLLLFIALPHGVVAASHLAISPAQLANICRTAQPGDTITVPNGTYTDQHFVLKATGTKERPITFRAETPGKVILNGTSRLSIGGDYLVVDGLQFRGGALASGSIIEFRGHSSPLARHCVLRNTTIIDYNAPKIDTRYFWVSLYGADNTVENCWFSGQTHAGVTLCVWLDGSHPARHVIRRNYFGNRPRGNKNGFETIRIGTSARSMTNARCLVAENLFERCDGEIEIVSNKSCENTYARNTFRHCSGCLTLRHGNRCKVEGNIFIGGNAKGAGGVRVIGEGHRIAGNHFSGTKSRAGGAISLQTGIPDSPLSGYFQVKDCAINGNTFIDNPGVLFALDAGYGKKDSTLLPETVTIADNLMVAPDQAKPMVTATRPPTGVVWKSNLAIGGTIGIEPPSGIQLTDAIPEEWRNRPQPQPLKQTDVGPGWLHGAATVRPTR